MGKAGFTAGDGESCVLTNVSDCLTHRRLFLIEGVITVGFGLLFALYLPNSPSRIMGFTEMEHDVLKMAYESDQKQQDDSSEVTAKQGFFMAVSDPVTWFMMGTLYAVGVSTACHIGIVR